MCFLILIAAACAWIGFLSMEKPVEIPERKERGGSLINREADEIQKLQIQIRGREAWTAVRDQDGVLRMDSENGWILDPTLSGQIEDAMSHLVYEDILTERAEEYQDRLPEFGLDDPQLTAKAFFSDGKEITIHIGNDSGIAGEDFHFMTLDGDPRLYAAAGSLVKDLYVERELLHPVKQPEIQTDRIDRITIWSAENEKTAEWKLSGSVEDIDADAEWQVTFPVVYPADQDQIAALKKNAANLRMGLFVAEVPNQNLAEYGLDLPSEILEIHLAPGATGRITEDGAYGVVDREEETVQIQIGGKRNEMTDYCIFEDAVYSINHFTLTAITEISPMDTLARYPVTVDPESLQSLVINRENGTSDHYIISYASSEAEDGQTERTNAVCQKNGEEISAEAFFAAYDRWRVVDLSGRLPEGWMKKKTRETYVFQTFSGRKHTIELSDFDAMHDAVTVDGATLFYLIKGGLGEMP